MLLFKDKFSFMILPVYFMSSMHIFKFGALPIERNRDKVLVLELTTCNSHTVFHSATITLVKRLVVYPLHAHMTLQHDQAATLPATTEGKEIRGRFPCGKEPANRSAKDCHMGCHKEAM
jgi:hypothetical protein